ncbi:MAG: Holliday junction resolvase-like protein [Thermosphaera sp.]
MELAHEILRRRKREIRRDAIARCQHTNLGRIGEHLSPLAIFLNYGVDLKDLRFIGSPIDYVAFKGYSGGKTEEIIFIEVKSGSSGDLEEKQKQVKEAVESCRIEWLAIHLPTEIENLKRAPSQRQENTVLKYLCVSTRCLIS